MTNKGSEKPWLASWGDYRQVVLKSLWRKLCRTFISISNEVWLRFSPQRAMFDWSFDSGLQDTTGYNQIHDQQGFLQTCLIFMALGYYTWFHDLGWTYLVFMVLGSAKLSFLYYYNILLIFFLHYILALISKSTQATKMLCTLLESWKPQLSIHVSLISVWRVHPEKNAPKVVAHF